MVKHTPVLVTLTTLFIVLALLGTATAQQDYRLEHEWVKIWINPEDGSIDLLYDVELMLSSGPNINSVYIGQPRQDFIRGAAMDQYGRELTVTDASSPGDYKVQVHLSEPLEAGQTLRFNVSTTVLHMIYEDTENPGNVGMKFIPTWWEEASVRDLQVQIVLPPGVDDNEVLTTEELWNGTAFEESCLSIYWWRQDLPPGKQYTFGVSFPKEYVEQYDTQTTGLVAVLQQYAPALVILGVAVFVLGAVVYTRRKQPYLKPSISIETLGIRRGLTAVEASYLLDLKPPQIVTAMLFSLLKKGAVWVATTTPALKLQITKNFQDKKGPSETPLRYYEIDFLDAIKEDGLLDERKLAHTVMFLRSTAEEKLRGYCRRDTIDYYRKVVSRAWEQVEQGGTSTLASQAYDEQLLWLFLTPDYRGRTQRAFQNRVFEPQPLWWWYWYTYRHYHPRPTYQPPRGGSSNAGTPPSIPGADFADNIATAVENTANRIVTNLEEFANAILPAPAAQPAAKAAHHRSSCVCACAACACVCACVSCACACAGGGVG